MDRISTPWVTIRLVQLLPRCVMTEETHDEGAAGADAPAVEEVNVVIEMKGSVHVGPFQAEILEGKISQAPAHDTHVIVAPIRHAEVKSGRACQLSPWATGVTCVHHAHCWQQASFDSGAEYD